MMLLRYLAHVAQDSSKVAIAYQWRRLEWESWKAILSSGSLGQPSKDKETNLGYICTEMDKYC
jgi:hypothetical protein